MPQELEITVILKKIKDSQESLAQIQDSVGPVSQTGISLQKVKVFLQEYEEEVTQKTAEKKKENVTTKLISFLTLLMPIAKLLKEFLAEAKRFFE